MYCEKVNGKEAVIMAGRNPKFESAEEMQKLIDEYFEECNGIILRYEEGVNKGNPIVDKYDNPVIIGRHPPTVTGLALKLGFSSRQSLLNYQGKGEFFDTITRAKMRIEEYAEERLFDREGVNGAKFSLVNNFKGWKDSAEIDVKNKGPVKIVNDIPRGNRENKKADEPK